MFSVDLSVLCLSVCLIICIGEQNSNIGFTFFPVISNQAFPADIDPIHKNIQTDMLSLALASIHPT